MDERVTLTTDEGEDIEFEIVTELALGEDFYAIMQPVKPLDGVAEDEALVFRIIETDDGDEYELVIDDDILDGVFESYNNMIEDL
ncbi:MAG: DUF1292 domain-containing protein [Clostridia bacterium]|nr:DUF1292 domain-containing protein [Clostridiales bacterium]MBR2442394.1 DUF1292 domain-containing protein [Clostridia bacterium]MBR2970320.1 DUF1292 domain-containing protein [Clostridia bacterium]